MRKETGVPGLIEQEWTGGWRAGARTAAPGRSSNSRNCPAASPALSAGGLIGVEKRKTAANGNGGSNAT
jgi:hypothetical protein